MGIIQKYKSLSPKIKEVINVAIVLSVLIGILLYLQLSGQLSDIVPIILSADKRWLFLALVFEIGFLACEIASLVVACKMMKVNLRVKDLISISLLGQLFGNLTPMASGSQPAQAWAFTRKGVSIGNATSALLSKFIIFQGVLTIYAAILLWRKFPFFVEANSNIIYIAAIGIFIHIFTFTVLMSIGFFPRAVHRLIKRILKLASKFSWGKKLYSESALTTLSKEMKSFQLSFRGLGKKPHLILAMCIVTAVQFTSLCLVPFCVLRSLGVETIDPFTALASASFILVIQSAVPLPGGAGGAEGGFALFFGMFTHSSHITWAALLIWRFITYYLAMLIETPSLLNAGRPPATVQFSDEIVERRK